MDPVSLIVGAVAAGASAAIKSSVSSAITTAYNALKRILVDRYSQVNTSALEGNPGSSVQQAAVKEVLEATTAGSDAELVTAARALLAAVKAEDPDAAKAVGVDLQRLDVDDVEIHDVKARGGADGVRARDITATKLNISGIDIDGTSPSHPR